MLKMELFKRGCSSQTEIRPSLVTFHDEKEDVFTQTDAYSSIHMKQKTILETPEAALEESAAEAMKYFESQLLTPVIQRRPNFYQRDKTPNTLKMLKEKHRENERQRHHSLNQHLRLICKKVPGSAEDGKETKVVMMQRIISYIAYLENTIKFMSSELNIRPQTSWLSLTSSVKDIEKSGTWRREFSVMSSDDSEDSQVFANNVSCRLKLSSPTIDSTTDSVPEDSVFPSTSLAVESDNLAQESQDSTVPTSSIFLEIDEDSSTRDCQDWLVPQVEVAIDERANFDGLLDQSEYDQELFELPSSTFEGKFMEAPDEVQWLGSPERFSSFYEGKYDNQFGIKCDLKSLDDQPYDMSHTIIVSPNQVMPQVTVKQEPVTSDTSDMYSMSNTNVCFRKVKTPRKHRESIDDGLTATRSKRKQSSPKRVPLFNITNWDEFSVHVNNGLDSNNETIDGAHSKQSLCIVFDTRFLCLSRNQKGEITFDMTGKLLDVNATTKLQHVIKTEIKEEATYDIEVPEQKLATESEKVVRETSFEIAGKIDLRKSSWMNGFMMYSRIHRKRFIKENPGLQASNISKMMGQAWRGMTTEEQQPYREQARICSQELQKMLDESYQL